MFLYFGLFFCIFFGLFFALVLSHIVPREILAEWHGTPPAAALVSALAHSCFLYLIFPQISEIEKEYAAKLTAACRSVPNASSALATTFDQAWGVSVPCLLWTWPSSHATFQQALLATVEERAKQHDLIADALMAEVCQPLKQLVKDATQTRHDNLRDVAAQRAELDKHVAAFDKVGCDTGALSLKRSYLTSANRNAKFTTRLRRRPSRPRWC